MKRIIKKDAYEIVTSRIIQKLEEGIIPWKQPWKNLGIPRNLVSQRPYRGVNVLLLNSLGHESNEFLTFKQVQDLGAHVKKGEKAHFVVLWLWSDESDRLNGDASPKKKAHLRYYFVFNSSQCIGIPKREGLLPIKSIETCEEIVQNMPNQPKIVHNEYEAYYERLADYINMPPMDSFQSSENYYSVLFHELIHATGAEDRLNRKELVEPTKFGSEMYSIEELTAEIGTCYLASHAGIAVNGLANNVACIQGWLKKLKGDKRFIVNACASAQKAVDYILKVGHEEDIAAYESLNSN